MNHIAEIARTGNGYITAAEAAAAGISASQLAHATRSGAVMKLARGLYALPGTWEDDYVVAQHRYAKGVFSHETALFLLGLTDRVPDIVTMTFPHGYNTGSARSAGIDAKTVMPGLHALGRTTATSPLGNEVVAYNAERTLCDLFRAQSAPDLQLALPAMRSYLSADGKNPAKVMRYARELGTEAKMRPYLEAML